MRIICLTSNGYTNVVPGFAHYWNRFAGARTVTVAGYDVKPDLPPNMRWVSIGRQADYTWSGGLLRLLDLFADDYFLLLLEDYWLSAPVDWRRIDELSWWMRMAPGIDKLDLSADRIKTPHREIGHLVQSLPDAEFQMSVQAAIWHRRMLERYLRADENAWQAEKRGSDRVNSDLHAGAGPLILGTRTPVLKYINAVGGAGSQPGVISPKYMPEFMRIESREKGWL